MGHVISLGPLTRGTTALTSSAISWENKKFLPKFQNTHTQNPAAPSPPLLREAGGVEWLLVV